MPNTSSAKKMLRNNHRRKLINKMRKSFVKTQIKKVLEAIKSQNKLEAIKAFREAQPHIQRAACKKIFHKNNVARKLSALSQKIKALPGEFVVGKIA
jgi:small subunit ribosomal protein S20